MKRFTFVLVIVLLGFTTRIGTISNPVAFADEPASISQRVDDLIAARHGEWAPAPLTDDAEFLRRVWLDFSGTIPTADETRNFLADTAPDKRIRIIDQLLAAPTYPRRMQELFHVILMERRGEHEAWNHYLRTSFEQNKPWNQLVAEMLYPNDQDESRKGAGFFYTKRLESYGQNPVDYPGLTRDVGRLFLGVDLQCAQCHNHLFIDDYKQVEFQGLYSVYLNLSIKGGVDFPAVTEKAMEKELEFVSVFDPTQRQTGPRVPFGKDIPIPVPPSEGAPISLLALLAEEFPKPENNFFSRNIANRLWFIMMGRGIVHPLDLQHANNPPTHPELLDLLSTEFIAHGYDIKWMLRELALTKTYQRSSRYPAPEADAASSEGQNAAANLDTIPPQSYSLFIEKRLSAEQLFHSVLQATGNLERLQQPTAEGKPNPDYVALKGKFVSAFANEPREAEEQINPTVKGALFVLNDESVLQLFARQPGNLIDKLLNLTDDAQLADELYLSLLTRLPTAQERVELSEYLTKNADRREKMLSLWAWSLVSSMEFVVNH